MTREELQAWRKAHGLSQAKLAKLLDVHVMLVSKWERGVHAVPRWVPRILEVLDKPAAPEETATILQKANAPASC